MFGWARTPRPVGGRVRGMLRRHWRQLLQLRERLRFSEEVLHLIAAGFVGVVGGLVDLLVYWLHAGLEALVLFDTRDVLTAVRDLPWWWRLILPAAGGLVGGLILFVGLRRVRMPGSTNLLEVVVAGDGRLRFRPGLLQSLSSMLASARAGRSGGRARSRSSAPRWFPSLAKCCAGSPIACGSWSRAARRRELRRPTRRRWREPCSPRRSCWAIFR